MQISRTPDVWVTLLGVVLAMLGLLGSLFIRPRRLWVRARREDGRTLVDVAGLDRSAGGDLSDELAEIVAALRPGPAPEPDTASPPTPPTARGESS